jgi:V8-like Glu-specific endopeptidase
MSSWYNALGHAVFDVEYRLPPPERWRDSVGDVKGAQGSPASKLPRSTPPVIHRISHSKNRAILNRFNPSRRTIDPGHATRRIEKIDIFILQNNVICAWHGNCQRLDNPDFSSSSMKAMTQRGYPMKSTHPQWLTTSLLSVSMTVATQGFSQTFHTDNDSVGVEIQESNKASGAGADYWTAERMRNAVPLDLQLDKLPSMDDPQPQEPDGPPVVTPGVKPLLKKSAVGSKQLYVPEEQDPQEQDAVEAPAVEDILLQNGERPHPFTGAEIFDSYEQYPLQTVGKVFFSQNGGDFVCSASALVSDNLRLVWTAGHCVAAGDGVNWSYNVRFVPAYRYGAAPFGSWDACGLYTTGAWFNNGDLAQDLGAVKVCDRGDGVRLHEVVGSLGFMANVDRVQHWNSFGYPAADPFNGEALHTCQAGHGRDDGGWFPMTIGIGCDMTGGSSGGPWILDFNRLGGGNYLNGLNSYGYGGLPNVMFSPYFGNEFLDLRGYAISNGA